MAPIRCIIDTDPGIDDMMALFLAFAHRDQLKVEGLTITRGNHNDLDLLAKNACRALHMCGLKGIPVVKGDAAPYANDDLSGIKVHGDDGLGNIFPDALPAEALEPMNHNHGSAAQFIATTCKNNPGEIVVITLGPLTNLAAALKLEPELPTLAKKVSTMAGALNIPGNKSPVAEANIHNDPEAADQVLAAGFNLVLAPLNVTRGVCMTSEFRRRVGETGTVGKFVFDITVHYVNLLSRWGTPVEDIPMHDSTAIMAVLHPELFTEVKTVPVRVETTGTFTLGVTVPDWRGHWREAAPKPVDVLWRVDAAAYHRVYEESIARLAAQ